LANKKSIKISLKLFIIVYNRLLTNICFVIIIDLVDFYRPGFLLI